MTADDVIDHLRRHHAEMDSQWAVLREAWAIDALAVGLSRGQRPPFYRWVAYEVKVSRADFATELRKWPGKAQRAIDFSHQYVFAVPPGLLSPEEMKRRAPEPGRRGGLWVPPLAGVLEVGVPNRVGRPVCKMAKRPETRQVARDLTPYDVACLVRYAYHAVAVDSMFIPAHSRRREVLA